MAKSPEKRVMIDCQIELVVSNELFQRIHDNKAELTKFVGKSAFRNNSRSVLGAHLFEIEDE